MLKGAEGIEEEAGHILAGGPHGCDPACVSSFAWHLSMLVADCDTAGVSSFERFRSPKRASADAPNVELCFFGASGDRKLHREAQNANRPVRALLVIWLQSRVGVGAPGRQGDR